MNKYRNDSCDTPPGPRQLIAAIEGRMAAPAVHGLFTLGHAPADARLGGGLARGRVHELFAAESEDAASAAACALMLAERAAPQAPILWIREEKGARRGGSVSGMGLVELGLDPARFLFAIVPDMAALLRVAGDILRCPLAGALILEAWGRVPQFDLTASRRLALAAEKSGVTALLLRIDAPPSPSAAQTRWEIRALPSVPLEADAPGAPMMELKLLRHRSGLPEQSWRMEWDRDRRTFRKPALPGALVPLSERGPAAAAEVEGWRLSA